MTVKCLSELDKAYLADHFHTLINRTLNPMKPSKAVADCASVFDVSIRTVIRILEELGVDPQVKHRKPKVDIELPYTPGSVQLFDPPARTPWYRRVLQIVGIHA